MGAGLIPGVREVFRIQRGISREKLCTRFALATKRFEQPDGNARADNTGGTAADIRLKVDAGMRIGHLHGHDG